MSDEIPEKKKATAAETEARVEIVINHIMMGRGRPWIVRYAAKEWGLASRSVDDLLAKARAEMRESNLSTREESMEQILSNYWLLYRQAMHKKDPYLALSILKEVAKVKGLNQEHVVHTIDDKRDMVDVPNSDLEGALETQTKLVGHGSH